jgi:hypothetical protein
MEDSHVGFPRPTQSLSRRGRTRKLYQSRRTAFLTQPAISDQVRKLEERFGVLLFHRNKRSVRLTDLGERLLGVTQRLFVIEAEAQELLQDSQALQTGSLILAVDAPVHVLPQIARFCERYPGISVKIETGNTDESLFRLFNYQADLALLGVMSAMNVCCAYRCATTRWWRSFRAIIRGPSVSRSAWRTWMTRRWCCGKSAR